MRKAKINPNTATKADVERMPAGVMRVADNYNHLHEQPTIFYAVALATQMLGPPDHISIGLAWGYVALRVLHSFIQVGGVVTIRFLIFNIATIMLVTLAVRTAMTMLGYAPFTFGL